MVEKIVPCNDGTEATDTNSSVPYDAAAGCSGALRELAKKQNKTYNAPYIKLFTTSPIFDRDNFPASIFEYSILKFDNVTECENVMKKQLPWVRMATPKLESYPLNECVKGNGNLGTMYILDHKQEAPAPAPARVSGAKKPFEPVLIAVILCVCLNFLVVFGET